MNASLLQTAAERHLPAALDLLRHLVAINSFTANAAGVDAVARLTAEAFAPLGFTAELVPCVIPGTGPHLRLEMLKYRTGVDITRVTLLELAHHPRIIAVKDCGGDPAKTLALIAQGRLQVLAGEDLHMFSTLAQGGVGAIAASAHVATAEFVRLLALLRVGDLIGARAVWSQLVPWIELAFSEPNPAVTKAALALDGSMDGMLRAPMQPASATACSKLAALCPALGLTIGVSRR